MTTGLSRAVAVLFALVASLLIALPAVLADFDERGKSGC